jgi:ABC-type sugar transport system substrate-binding protein
MKKTILIAALVLAALAVAAVGAGVAFAQDETPPFGGHGPMRNGAGPLHTFMVTEFAKTLDLNVNDINTRLAAGETMYDIALSVGVSAEEFSTIMTEVRAAALDAAVAANVITQEQADWMNSRGFGQGGMGSGNCNGTGSQGRGGGNGRGMMGGWGNQQVNP